MNAWLSESHTGPIGKGLLFDGPYEIKLLTGDMCSETDLTRDHGLKLQFQRGAVTLHSLPRGPKDSPPALGHGSPRLNPCLALQTRCCCNKGLVT